MKRGILASAALLCCLTFFPSLAALGEDHRRRSLGDELDAMAEDLVDVKASLRTIKGDFATLGRIQDSLDDLGKRIERLRDRYSDNGAGANVPPRYPDGEQADDNRQPWTEAEFQQFAAQVKASPFTGERLKTIERAAKDRAFLCEEVAQLMRLFPMDSDRISVVELTADAVSDTRNLYKLRNEIVFDAKKSELDNFLDKR